MEYVANRNYQLQQKENLEKELASLIDQRDFVIESIKISKIRKMNNKKLKISKNSYTL
jgi:hypothetical protein